MKKINTVIKILIAEHDKHDLAMIDNELKEGGIDFVSEIVQNEEGYRKALKHFIPDIILCDYRFPSFDGPTAFKIREQVAPETPFILVSGTIGEEISIELIKNGVTDFVLKDKMFALTTKLLRALRDAKASREKSKIEQDLKRTMAHLDEAQSLAKLGSWDFDFAADKLTWSEQLYNVFDIDKQTFNETHGSFLHLIDDSDREYAEKTSKHTQETGDAFIIEYGITTHKGEKRVIQEHGYGIKDVTGKVIRLFGTAQDITESKKSAIALKSAYDEKNAVLESIDDGFFAVDKYSKVTYWNKKAEILLDQKREDLIGKNVHEVFAGEDSKAFNDQYKKAIKENSTIHFEEFSKRRNKWFAVSAFGSENGLSVYFKDVTERKKSEEKIKESEARLAASQSVAKVGSWETDLTNLDVIWSDETCRIFGVNNCLPHTSHENFLKFVHPDDKEKVDKALVSSLTSDSLNSIEHRIIAADGILKEVEERWLIAKDENGKAIRALGTVQDITERKKAAKIEYELHTRLKAIFEKTNDAIVLADDSGNYVQVNPAAAKMLGYSLQELTGMNTADLISGRQTDELWNEFMQDGSQTGAIELVRKDGSLVICHYNASSNILPGLHLSILTDITEQKKAENAIKESEARYRAFFENSMDGILLTNPDGSILAANPAACEMLQRTEREICEAGRQGLIDPQDPNLIPLLKTRELTGKAKGEITFVRKDGSVFPGELASTVFTDGLGNKRTYMIFRDISESKQSKKALLESEARLNEAQEIAHLGSWEIRFDSAEWLWSKEACMIFGLLPEDNKVTHERWLSFIHPDDLNEVSRITDETAQTGIAPVLNYRIRLKDGSIKNIYAKSRFESDKNGTPVAIHGIVLDVTERLIAEAERERIIVSLVEKSKKLEQFTFIVSHNLRAPVAQILGLSHVLKNSITDTDRLRSEQFLFIATERLDLILKDLNKILDVKSEVSEHKEPVFFNELVHDITGSISKVVEREHVRIETNFNSVDRILSVKSYLYSIFYNLILNSIKYKQRNKPPLIKITSGRERQKIKIVFQDNGIGIDLLKHGEKIFGLYQRFNLDGDGQGLGLYMVKIQVEALGGSIRVESKEGEGTEFIIELPV
ncbi:MAG: domain S-box protein [Bacteroidota bacterium]|jgi:PAS domain S-box-containing protein|nr:domain S-box protein [Bacteroidota bacterium]